MEADDDTTDGSEQLMQAKDPRRGCALLVTDAAVEILSDLCRIAAEDVGAGTHGSLPDVNLVEEEPSTN
jgi:hypothetical protein